MKSLCLLLLGRGFLLKKYREYRCFRKKINGIRVPFIFFRRIFLPNLFDFTAQRLDKKRKRNYFSNTVLIKQAQGENR
jgi:hypothetical protein